MTNSNSSSATPSEEQIPKFPSGLVISLLVISFLGFADASYLAILHFQNAIPPCSIVEGCEVVTTSQYSTIFGIPVALLGAIYYAILLLLSAASLQTRNIRLLTVTCFLTTAGLFASAWFVFAQLALLKAFCLYCMGSATTSTVLFIVGMITTKKIAKFRQKT